MISECRLNDVRARLRGLGLEVFISKEDGICDEILNTFSFDLDSLIFKKWPKFSGSWQFPIPSGSEISAEAAYKYAGNTWSSWPNQTRYGAMRLELCLWLADHVTVNDFRDRGFGW